MTSTLPSKWPKRPKGFHEEWNVFCTHALSEMITAREDPAKGGLAVVLLTAGAMLGGVGLTSLVIKNNEAIDRQGKEWGIDNLSTFAGMGSAVLGAAMGAFGSSWLTRILSRHADAAKVDALQARLAAARREFEALRADRVAGRLAATHHQLAVERLLHSVLGRAGAG